MKCGLYSFMRFAGDKSANWPRNVGEKYLVLDMRIGGLHPAAIDDGPVEPLLQQALQRVGLRPLDRGQMTVEINAAGLFQIGKDQRCVAQSDIIICDEGNFPLWPDSGIANLHPLMANACQPKHGHEFHNKTRRVGGSGKAVNKSVKADHGVLLLAVVF